jgi:hypothetical protein
MLGGMKMLVIEHENLVYRNSFTVVFFLTNNPNFVLLPSSIIHFSQCLPFRKNIIMFISAHMLASVNSLFSKNFPLSTYAHYFKRDTDDDMQELARNFLLSLEPGEF